MGSLVVLGDSPASASSPCPGPDSPCLTLTPSSGPVGTTVRISGHIHSDIQSWRQAFRDPGYFALVSDFAQGFPGHPGECELLVGGDGGKARVSRDGAVKGAFVVGGTGSCFQQSGRYATQPGRYYLSIGCHACQVAVFDVSASLPFTGSWTVWQMQLTGLLLLLGAAFVLAGRRRAQPI